VWCVVCGGGNNSLAIAAPCRGSERDAGVELRRARWGVVVKDGENSMPRHCCATREEVEMPKARELYVISASDSQQVFPWNFSPDSSGK
jgi:hypothetical protein